MSLKLVITDEEPIEHCYQYTFVFKSNDIKFSVQMEHDLDIMKYESLLEAMNENTQYSCIESIHNGELSISTEHGFTSFRIEGHVGEKSATFNIKLKNHACTTAIKQFIDHKKLVNDNVFK